MTSKAINNRNDLLQALYKQDYEIKPKQSCGEYNLIKDNKKIGLLCIAGKQLTIIFK